MKENKIAVFDLDDTLYHGNSHFAILNQYYQTKIFTSILARILGKLFPIIHLKIAYYFYNRIPLKNKCSFTLPYRHEVKKLFMLKRQAGYHMIILSNAPLELLSKAASDLDVDWIKAEVGKKSEALMARYEYKELFVCTDNVTDLDLINIADEAVITCLPRKRKFFRDKVTCKKYSFIEELDKNEM